MQYRKNEVFLQEFHSFYYQKDRIKDFNFSFKGFIGFSDYICTN